MKNIKEQIKNLLDKYPRHYAKILLRNEYQDLLKTIKDLTPLLQTGNYNIPTMVNWILTDRHDFPTCEYCKKKFGHNRKLRCYDTYSKTCSAKCANNLSIDTIKNVKLQKYGNANFNNTKKAKQTCLERYGVDNPNKLKSIIKKIEQTKLLRYGDKHFTNQKKRKQTCLKKYGYPSSNQAASVKKLQHKKYYYDNKWFSSSWEIAYYIWLIDHKIQFKYQPAIQFEYIVNGKKHVYQPDFLVENNFIEIKGNQFLSADKKTLINPYDKTHSSDLVYKAKFDCMKKNNVQILYYQNIKKYLDYISKKYNINYKKFFSQFKKVDINEN